MKFEPLILIAEDDPDDALMLRDAFQEIQIGSLTFLENGKHLIHHIDELSKINKAPELIIVDLNMPVLDGRSVIQILKKDKATHQIPLVVLSTTKDKEDISSVLALGANDFYTKPATFNELIVIANSIFKKWLA